MSIYSNTNYRKIYEQHFGTIPKDNNGHSYEIHHIDGNHSNNNITNLICVSIQEHYVIHYAQGDWAACLRIASRANIPSVEVSFTASMTGQTRNKNPNYINPFKKRSDGSSVSSDRATDGTHHYLKRDDGTSMSSDRVLSGLHNFITNHPNKTIVICPHCNKSGGRTNMHRFHFKNCSENLNKLEIQKELFTCEYCGIITNKGNYIRWHSKNCRCMGR
jgi:hypothetical protein